MLRHDDHGYFIYQPVLIGYKCVMKNFLVCAVFVMMGLVQSSSASSSANSPSAQLHPLLKSMSEDARTQALLDLDLKNLKTTVTEQYKNQEITKDTLRKILIRYSLFTQTSPVYFESVRTVNSFIFMGISFYLFLKIASTDVGDHYYTQAGLLRNESKKYFKSILDYVTEQRYLKGVNNQVQLTKQVELIAKDWALANKSDQIVQVMTQAQRSSLLKVLNAQLELSEVQALSKSMLTDSKSSQLYDEILKKEKALEMLVREAEKTFIGFIKKSHTSHMNQIAFHNRLVYPAYLALLAYFSSYYYFNGNTHDLSFEKLLHGTAFKRKEEIAYLNLIALASPDTRDQVLAAYELNPQAFAAIRPQMVSIIANGLKMQLMNEVLECIE